MKIRHGNRTWQSAHINSDGSEAEIATFSLDTSNNVTGLVGPDDLYDLRPKIQTPGGVFCNWQASTGTLAMVSTDAGDDVALDTAAAIKTIIDQAEANGEWAVLTFHRVVASGAGSLETTTTIFEEVCTYLDARRSAGHLDVLPFGRAYDRYFK